MLIPLICTQCGAKLEVEKTKVIESGNSVVVATGETFQCSHCGMNYLSGEKIRQDPAMAIISIRGNVIGSNIIIGNSKVIDQKQKKWWQFWKK